MNHLNEYQFESEYLSQYSVNHYDLFQWLNNELPNCQNYGYAKSVTFSFFGLQDEKTLNNIIGKTSESELFAYNLTNGIVEHLTINNDIVFKSKFTTNFFERIIEP